MTTDAMRERADADWEKWEPSESRQSHFHDGWFMGYAYGRGEYNPKVAELYDDAYAAGAAETRKENLLAGLSCPHCDCALDQVSHDEKIRRPLVEALRKARSIIHVALCEQWPGDKDWHDADCNAVQAALGVEAEGGER